jgi:hypothetical protein
MFVENLKSKTMENLNYIYDRKIGEIHFPIQVSDVYYKHLGQPDKLQDPDHKAIIRGDSGEVLGMVGSKYEVITHSEAYRLGRSLFKEVFGSRPTVFKVDMNNKGSYCHVDLLNPKERISIKGIQKARDYKSSINEEYYPFIRISNSYNHTFALRYNLGFYRWKCANGLLMGAGTLGDIVISHDRPLEESEWYVMDAAEEFAKQINEFDEYVRRAGSIHIPKELLEVVTMDMLDRRYGLDQKPKLLKMSEVLRGTVPAYAAELGESALAAINIATDYIKTVENTQTVNSLQSRAMDWGMKVTGENFNMASYLNELRTYKERVIEKAHQF